MFDRSRLEALLNSSNPYVVSAVAGAKAYAREVHLPRIVAIYPHELVYTLTNAENIVTRLEERLDAAKRLRGNWAYDINWHQAIISAYVAEAMHLMHLRHTAQTA